MDKVLITGITGFLGSHIAETLVQNNVEIIGLKRLDSDIWRCKDFEEKIYWIDLDEADEWKESVKRLNPAVIIHCAWIGVEASKRNLWHKQIKNIDFQLNLLEIAEAVNLKQFLVLGSQAEYGHIDNKVTEDYETNTTTAYGSVKLACLQILKTFCEQKSINWVWLRVFSIFGEKEDQNWLIPSVIKKMQTDREMDFTSGEQKYAYMYVKDFSKIVYTILMHTIYPGVYNISSDKLLSLKLLIEDIRQQLNPNFQLNFGVLPYREGQSMHIEGDISKITRQIGSIDFTDFSVALSNTINYYILK